MTIVCVCKREGLAEGIHEQDKLSSDVRWAVATFPANVHSRLVHVFYRVLADKW